MTAPPGQICDALQHRACDHRRSSSVEHSVWHKLRPRVGSVRDCLGSIDSMGLSGKLSKKLPKNIIASVRPEKRRYSISQYTYMGGDHGQQSPLFGLRSASILFSCQGSILPRLLISAVPAAAAAYVLNLYACDIFGCSSPDEEDEGLVRAHPYGHQTLAVAVGFSLVLRLQQAYGRWWDARCHMHDLSGRLLNFLMQMIAYDHDYSEDGEDGSVDRTCHRDCVVHLLSLTSALMLQHLTQHEDLGDIRMTRQAGVDGSHLISVMALVLPLLPLLAPLFSSLSLCAARSRLLLPRPRIHLLCLHTLLFRLHVLLLHSHILCAPR